MKDFTERLEDCAEQQYDNMLQSNGRLKCGCGKVFDPDTEGGTVSLNPYAMPICGDCLEDWLRKEEL